MKYRERPILLYILMLSCASNLLAQTAQQTPLVNTNDDSYKVIPIVLSILAFLFSIISLVLTTYNQYLKKPFIRMVLGQRVKAFGGYDNRLGLYLNVILFNSGAQYGAIYKISGNILHRESGDISDFVWESFVESKNVGTPGERFQPHDSFIGWAETLIIPNRAAVEKRILFVTVHPFRIIEGTYEIKLFGFEGHNLKASCEAQSTFKVSSEAAQEFIKTKTDKETRISKHSVRFPLLPLKAGRAK